MHLHRDFETTRRRQWLSGEAPKTYDEKRAAALAFLGERWLLHPSHAPKRLSRPYGDGKAVPA